MSLLPLPTTNLRILYLYKEGERERERKCWMYEWIDNDLSFWETFKTMDWLFDWLTLVRACVAVLSASPPTVSEFLLLSMPNHTRPCSFLAFYFPFLTIFIMIIDIFVPFLSLSSPKHLALWMITRQVEGGELFFFFFPVSYRILILIFIF